MNAPTGSDGWLALVATPIGNLDDITLRALEVLKEADLVAAEDTRRTRKLCSHFDISVSMTSFHAHNEYRKVQGLLDKVQRGQRLALVSDAGTPSISDPGYLIVREALKRGIEPRVIPGPSALTYAVVASGLPVDRFSFHGYPPRKTGKRRNFLRELEGSDTTVFLFASVHRIGGLLEDIVEVLGSDTEIVVLREVTKAHEERLRGTAREIFNEHGERNWKGELVVGMNLREG